MNTQVMISTQSPGLLDHFDRDDIVIVQKESSGTCFSRPDPDALESWLEEYTLGEVWEKNVFGGGPF
jgi:predicted ATPase